MAHRHPKTQFTHPAEAQALVLKRNVNRREGSVGLRSKQLQRMEAAAEVVRLCHYPVTMKERFKHQKEKVVFYPQIKTAWFMGPHFNYLYS